MADGSKSVSRSIAAWSAGGVALMCVVVLLGWELDLAILRRGVPDAPQTTPLTAVCLLLLAAALGRADRLRWIPCALVAALVVTATTQYLFEWGVGAERLLYWDQVYAISAQYPGRPSPHTVVALSLLAASLTVDHRRHQQLGSLLAGLGMAVAWVALFGYASQTNPLYALDSAPEVGMSPLTALGALAIGVGAIWLRPDVGFPVVLRAHTSGGALARRLLPAAVLAPLLLSWLVAYRTHASPIDAQGTISLSWGLTSIALAGLTVWMSQRVHDADVEMGAFNAALKQRVDEMTVELQERNEALEHSNAELQQFAYVASHDLKAPLRRVTSFVQLLERTYRGKLDDDADEWIGYITTGIKDMQGLVEGALAYSRVDSRGTELVDVDLEDVVDVALTRLGDALENATVTRGPLPHVMGDRMQLIQLVQNLVGNAAIYTGGEPARIEIGATRRGGDGVALAVRDHGIGIDPAHHERIFDLFGRAHEGEPQGTGLGLAIARRIARRHGGDITVESEPGAGSTFTVRLQAPPPS